MADGTEQCANITSFTPTIQGDIGMFVKTGHEHKGWTDDHQVNLENKNIQIVQLLISDMSHYP